MDVVHTVLLRCAIINVRAGRKILRACATKNPTTVPENRVDAEDVAKATDSGRLSDKRGEAPSKA